MTNWAFACVTSSLCSRYRFHAVLRTQFLFFFWKKIVHPFDFSYILRLFHSCLGIILKRHQPACAAYLLHFHHGDWSMLLSPWLLWCIGCAGAFWLFSVPEPYTTTSLFFSILTRKGHNTCFSGPQKSLWFHHYISHLYTSSLAKLGHLHGLYFRRGFPFVRLACRMRVCFASRNMTERARPVFECKNISPHF